MQRIVLKTVSELRADPRVLEVERRLKRAGISDAWWNGILERVHALPAQYAKVTRETRDEAAKRRGELADRMRDLAQDLTTDSDAGEFYPVPGNAEYPPSLNIGAFQPGTLSLAEWLLGCADELEAGSSWDATTKLFRNRRGIQFKSFVIKAVFGLIEFYLAQGRQLGVVNSGRPKNKETALLASALIDEDITANDVTQARRATRQSYPYRRQ